MATIPVSHLPFFPRKSPSNCLENFAIKSEKFKTEPHVPPLFDGREK